jgi:eukaryotic-like serine/threonine-protein kinase
MVTGDAARSGPRTVGRYVVYGEIASGGMATVHFGRLTGLAGFARSVAIKRLHAHFAKDPEFVKMFLDEARLAARITHPNVVATLDVVQSGEELFLVMDYVRGLALSQLLRAARRAGERMPPLIATGIVAGALHGLHAAHEAKNEVGQRLDIVHRDVSPQNVLVGTDGVARVLDFGVAKAAGRMQETRDGQLKGKLSYMAPEQIQGAAVTRRTDVYAASVVLWETLTGERLFKGDNEANVLAKVLAGAVPPPSLVSTGLSSSLDRVVLRGLAPEPGSRYATAREMAQDLDAAFGVASAAEIGDWVERVAAQELEDRARRIAEIERGASEDDVETSVRVPTSPGRDAPDAPTPVGRREPEETTARKPSLADAASQVSSVSVAQPTGPPAGPAGRTRKPWVAIVGGATALVLLLVAVVVGVTRAAAPRAGAEPPASTSLPSSAPPPLDLPASPVPTAPEATASATPAAPSAPVSTPAPAAPAMTVPAAHPPPVHAARPTDCTPPYTTDAKGHVHFKPQCM